MSHIEDDLASCNIHVSVRNEPFPMLQPLTSNISNRCERGPWVEKREERVGVLPPRVSLSLSAVEVGHIKSVLVEKAEELYASAVSRRVRGETLCAQEGDSSNSSFASSSFSPIVIATGRLQICKSHDVCVWIHITAVAFVYGISTRLRVSIDLLFWAWGLMTLSSSSLASPFNPPLSIC